ncbi:MAG: hypothetical protein KA118_09295 [Verrucomicrobia bacterium]|nr:hypothetical protein [Verrucomicrobiota bacterium]
MSFALSDPRPQPPLNSTPFHLWTAPDGSPWTYFYLRGHHYIARFPGMADFELSADGASIQCYPVPGTPLPTIEHLYLNQVLPLALSRQGKLVFHASAIESQAGALVFMGPSGRGKSTLAASFAQNRFRILADDALQIDKTADGAYQARPGHRSIRLWADSQAAVAPGSTRRAPSLDHTDKARLLPDSTLAFCPTPRPLHRIYLLGDDTVSETVFLPVRPRDALIEMLRHSFILDFRAPGLMEAHFDRLADLVRQPIHYRLEYPRRYDRLPALCQAILDHAAACA